ITNRWYAIAKYTVLSDKDDTLLIADFLALSYHDTNEFDAIVLDAIRTSVIGCPVRPTCAQPSTHFFLGSGSGVTRLPGSCNFSGALIGEVTVMRELQKSRRMERVRFC
ncbi:hypothetical protein L915_20125, partial [Phytophthora nicotianae]